MDEDVIVVAFKDGKPIATKTMRRSKWIEFFKNERKSQYNYKCFQIEYYNRIFLKQ